MAHTTSVPHGRFFGEAADKGSGYLSPTIARIFALMARE